MAVFRVFRSLIALLTSIPAKADVSFVETSARFMFLFPVIGGLIGLLAGIYAFFAYHLLTGLFNFANSIFFSGSQSIIFSYLTRVLASVMTLAFLLVLTGLQHMDGLIDVGNALSIRKASVDERKMLAHAWVVTRLGAFIAMFVSYCTVLLITLINPVTIIQSLLVAEVSAKLAMVTCAWQGSSPQMGLGSIFIDSMKRKHSLYLVSLTISILIGTLLLGLQGLLAVTSSIAVGGLMIVISKRIFGGVTGDIFGAANEITRMTALFALVW